ncbi:MAG: hypothetical protein J5717_09630 [Lachnospiraceae bacterium]|nr:hypothetical protein [Lachnospiraceae bacterium]
MNISLNLNQEESKKITGTKELVECILESGNEVSKMSDEERAEMDARIMAKLQSGKKLSEKELNYLQRTNPVLYAQALRVQRMAEAVEERLKHAKSKEEAANIISSALSGISQNDPYREYIYAAISRVVAEFHDSDAYNKLPDTIEDAKRKNSGECGDVFKDAGDSEDADDCFGLLSWSPLTEVYDSLPSFTAQA